MTTELFLDFEAIAGLDYFDDSGTNMGVFIQAENSNLCVTVGHSIPNDVDPTRGHFQPVDHPVNKLMGRRCRVVIEIIDPDQHGADDDR